MILSSQYSVVSYQTRVAATENEQQNLENYIRKRPFDPYGYKVYADWREENNLPNHQFLRDYANSARRHHRFKQWEDRFHDRYHGVTQVTEGYEPDHVDFPQEEYINRHRKEINNLAPLLYKHPHPTDIPEDFHPSVRSSGSYVHRMDTTPGGWVELIKEIRITTEHLIEALVSQKNPDAALRQFQTYMTHLPNEDYRGRNGINIERMGQLTRWISHEVRNYYFMRNHDSPGGRDPLLLQPHQKEHPRRIPLTLVMEELRNALLQHLGIEL